MTILGLAFIAAGYAVAYYGINILVDAYVVQGTVMNPAPLTVLLGIPGAGAGAASGQGGGQANAGGQPGGQGSGGGGQ